MSRSQEPLESTDPTDDYPFWRRVRRSLARRFPRIRIAYNWSKARIRHTGSVAKHRTIRFATTFTWAADLAAQIRQLRREPGLTVGVDVASLWEPLTGVGWYLYRLLEEAADSQDVRIRLFPPTIVASDDIPEPVISLPQGSAIQLVKLEVPPERVVFAGAMIRFLRRIEPLLRAAMGNRVLFAPNFYLPRSFSLSKKPLVATIHDLGSVQVPWTLSDDTLEALSRRLELSLSNASRIITVSNSVRDELVKNGYPHPNRIHPIHHGPGHLSEIKPSTLPAGTPERYALHVGTLEPRKNISTLIEAWRILFESIDNAPPLLLSGQYGWKSDDIRSQIGAAERRGQVLHLGYVEDQQLAALYEHATVVVLASIYEGFGLPAVEAQFAGAPLVCSDIPVLHEVAGEGALYAPPDRADLLAEAVQQVVTDDSIRETLIRNGADQVSKLSWAKTAADTIDVWRAAAAPEGTIDDGPSDQ
jgi:glycosyltransferase involved in cell wall biosynthesis